MSTGPRRPRKTRKQWEAIMADFQHSPLSLRDFCQDQNLAIGTFSKWRQRLSKPSPKPVSPLLELIPPTQAVPSEPDTWQVELALGNGMTLRIRTL